MTKTLFKYFALLALFIVPIGWSQSVDQHPPEPEIQYAEPHDSSNDSATVLEPAPGRTVRSGGGFGMAGGMGGGASSGYGGMAGGMGGGMAMGGYGRTSTGSDRTVRIFDLEYRAASEIQEILVPLVMDPGTMIQADERTNRLIVVTTPNNIKNIENLIQQLDIQVKGPAQESSLNVTYQVFAVEAMAPGVMGRSGIPVTLQIVLPAPNLSSFNQFLSDQDSIAIKDMDSEAINQDDRKYTIQGMVNSEEDFNNFLQNLQNTVQQIEIVQRSLENPLVQSPYQVPEGIEIPEKVQSIIQRFLGHNTEIIAYWFGNSTVPGRSKARLGEFELQMSTDPAIRDTFGLTVSLRKSEDNAFTWAVPDAWDASFFSTDMAPAMPGTGTPFPSAAENPNETMEKQAAELYQQQLEKELRKQPPGTTLNELFKKKGRRDLADSHKALLDTLKLSDSQKQVVLENTVTCRVGQPVVIGYTRQDQNTTRQGALVLVPETELAGAAPQSSAPIQQQEEAPSSNSSVQPVQPMLRR